MRNMQICILQSHNPFRGERNIKGNKNWYVQSNDRLEGKKCIGLVLKNLFDHEQMRFVDTNEDIWFRFP